jgi:alkaline phosphatase D
MRKLDRREILLQSAGLLGTLALPLGGQMADTESVAAHNAIGERVGEVSADSAIVHTRLTANPTRNNLGYSFPVFTHNLDTIGVLSKIRLPHGLTIADLEGSCAGKPGRIRLHYSQDPNLSKAASTEWVEVGSRSDYSHQFHLGGLNPGSRYYYRVEIAALNRKTSRRGETGSFRTAPEPGRWAPVQFLAVSCQDYACRDHLDGYRTYKAMSRHQADFVASIGDNVYYDLDLPFATSVELARFHWHRMYSQPLVMDLFRNTAGYWLKDDHDSHEDDNWSTRPTQRVSPMTYQDLSPVFAEQVPMGPSTYRRFRWGRGLEVWLVENRDFRSPNWDPDGAEKTIWGAKQKEWLKRSLLESNADFRVLISPNCIVGPDPGHGPPFKFPGGGADSHGDGGFGFEGREFRHWVKENRLTNFITINGDRHWQYHSVDPETGLQEFCCGAVTDAHSVKDKVLIPKYHKFLRTLGGYLSLALEGSAAAPVLTVRLHDVDGHVVHKMEMKRS